MFKKTIEVKDIYVESTILSDLSTYLSCYNIICEGKQIVFNINWPEESLAKANVFSNIKFTIDFPHISKIKNESKRINMIHSEKLLEIFLYHLFIIINLSHPGSFDLHHANFITSNIPFKQKKRSIKIIDLCNDMFDDALYNTDCLDIDKFKWPLIQQIPLQKTIEWYKSLNIGLKPLASNRIERAIYALLHISLSYGYGIDKLIWLIHALESLYETPKTYISKFLKNRVFLILSKPEEHVVNITKLINKFYDIRSDFVHGTLEIYHPVIQEHDDKTYNYFNQLIDPYHLAFRILLSTIQKMIIEDWDTIDFSEKYIGRRTLV